MVSAPIRGTSALSNLDRVERVRREYTDKYVVADANRPELARFRDHVGQVRTVNMSGRALVEFIDYHLNIGWFDIDLDYLKVVDKPAPKEKAPAAKKPAAKKPAAKKPAAAGGEKKLSPLEMARMQGAAGKGGAAEKPAPAKKQAPAASKPDRAKMSVAEMLAAARAEKSGGAPAAAEEAPLAEPEPAAAEPATESSASDVVKVDRSTMSVAEMIAHCRENDAS